MIRKALSLALASLLLLTTPAFAQSGGGPSLPIPVPVSKGGTGATTAAGARANLGAGTGSGDVVGPASITDNALPLFDGTTGKLIKGIAAPAVGQVLKSNGVGVAPSWSASLALSGNGALSAPGLTGYGTWITGGTATTTKPYALIEPTGTTSTAWSTSGTGLGINAASGFSGNLIDTQLNGVLAFKVDQNGTMTFGGSNAFTINGSTGSIDIRKAGSTVYLGNSSFYLDGSGQRLSSSSSLGWTSSAAGGAANDVGLSRISAGVIGVGTGAQGSVAGGLQAATLALGGATIGSDALAVTGATTLGAINKINGSGYIGDGSGAQVRMTVGSTPTMIVNSTGYFGFSNGNIQVPDVFWTRGGAAATFQHGAADAAAPVAQTIKFQDVAAGTSNTAGANAKIQAPAGTGTGKGGSLIFQVAAAGSSGSAKNAWATALTIDGTKLATFGSGVTATGPVTASYFRNGTNQFHLYGTAGGIQLYDSTETLSFTLVPGASNLATFNGGITAGSNIIAPTSASVVAGYLRNNAKTVATLTSAAMVQGARAFVTDASATMAAGIGATVTGGGSNIVPVYSDGTNWIIGDSGQDQLFDTLAANDNATDLYSLAA